MADFEFEYNQQDKDLILTQEDRVLKDNDYVRLTIYPSEAINNIVTLSNGKKALFYYSLNETSFFINTTQFSEDSGITNKEVGGNNNNDFQIYKNVLDESIYIKPNEIFESFELPQGDYRIQIDFLNQLNRPDVNPVDTDDGVVDDSEGDTVLDDDFTGDDSEDEVIINPNNSFYNFIVRQISTTRKEVRLKLIGKQLNDESSEIQHITNEFNYEQPEFLDDGTSNPNYKYQFKHVWNMGTGDHIPIMNYKFDRVTDGKDNQSIILKLYDVLPGNVLNLSRVTIEREVLTTQIQDTF